MSRIDIHHHVISQTYRQMLERAGVTSVAGSAFPRWDLDRTLERMAQLDIDLSLLSISAPGVCFAPVKERAAMVRDLNDEQAACKASEPTRIGMLACLPLPDVDAAIAEIARSDDELHADGVVLLTNYDGIYLSDPRLDPVLAALNERAAVVLVHPNTPISVEPTMQLPPSLLEFTFDTTRLAADMIVRGTLHRYPDMRFVLAHLGGALPFLSWRLSMMEDRRRDPWAGFADRGESVQGELRRFYFDTAMSAGATQLRQTVSLVGADRLVYGSDTPFGPPSFIDKTGQQLGKAGLSEDQRRAIDHDTLAALLDQITPSTP